MLKTVKRALLAAADASAFNSVVLHSPWRTQRLLILCYHSLSLVDEHLWDPDEYMPPSLFRERLDTIRRLRCTVLPLREALALLHTGKLPNRSIAITFDDGTYDFYSLAWPILREFGYPATLYFTTYYSGYSRPVFDPMCSYILWKGREQTLDWAETVGQPIYLDGSGRSGAHRQILSWAAARRLDARQKDRLLGELSAKLKIDYEELCRMRILQIMTSTEAAELARQGLDIQLHTHRHRAPREHDLFAREIVDNRRAIARSSQVAADHFCYPSGLHLAEFPDWLRELGVSSAVTCEAGLATQGTDRFLLPRLVDTTGLTGVEFRAWLSGLASLLPRRPHVMPEALDVPDQLSASV